MPSAADPAAEGRSAAPGRQCLRSVSLVEQTPLARDERGGRRALRRGGAAGAGEGARAVAGGAEKFHAELHNEGDPLLVAHCPDGLVISVVHG